MLNKVDSLKILHVIPSVAPCRGGPSKAILEMVCASREIGIDAEVATTNDDGPRELDIELDQLVDFRGMPTRFFQRFPSKISAVREFAYSPSFKEWLAQRIHNYDLLHIHALFSFCPSYAMSLARKVGKPYIIRPIGQLENWSLTQSRVKKKIYLSLLEKANIEGAGLVHFTAHSEAEQATLGLKLPQEMPNARQRASEYWPIDCDTPCLVFLGRLHQKKGLKLLIRALSQLQNKNIQLIIAGDGEVRHIKQLKALCIALGVAQQCHFVGFVEGHKKDVLLQRADLFVLTSYSENFGIAVLEAMACGATPLVSQEVALSGVIKENTLGLVCELTVEDISAKLSHAFENLHNIAELGRNARKFVAQNFQWPAIAEQLERNYQEVLNR